MATQLNQMANQIMKWLAAGQRSKKFVNSGFAAVTLGDSLLSLTRQTLAHGGTLQ